MGSMTIHKETINDTTLVNGFSDDNHYKETINDTTLVNGFRADNHYKETINDTTLVNELADKSQRDNQ